MEDLFAHAEIVLSEERRTILEPKLRALLGDFRQLAALETPDVEPMPSPQHAEEDDDASR